VSWALPLEAGPHLGGLELPPPGPARRLAWSELGALYARKGRAWTGLVLEDGASHATLSALEAVDGLVRRTLAIKASPPVYTGIVDDLGAALVSAWGVSEASVWKAAEDAAEIATRHGRGKVGTDRVARRLDQLQAELAARGVDLAKDPKLAETYAGYLGAAFTLGQLETTKPLGWEVGWSLVDQDAIAGLSRSGLWWIGKAHGDALDTGKLLAEVEGMVRDGMGREDGARRLRAAFGTEFHRSDAYWRGLAATVATRSRSFGALSGMEATGATRYEYVNPLDERTSDVCRELDGTTFTVKGAIELRDRLVGAVPATDPEAWKAIAPWPKVKDLSSSGGDRLSPAELQAKGIAWPPLHFHCRSSIDVVTWAEIRPEDLDGPGAVERAGPTPKPTPKPTKAKPAPPALPPPPKVSPWDQAKADLASARARATALGLDPDRAGLSAGTARDLQAWYARKITDPARPRMNRYRSGVTGLEDIGQPAVASLIPKAPTSKASRWLEVLEGTAADHDLDRWAARELTEAAQAQALGHWHDPARVKAARDFLDQARPYWSDPALAARIRDEVKAIREVQAAFRRAVELAPPDVLEAWRVEATRKILADVVLPATWGKAQREALEAAAVEAWRGLPVDHLRLFRLEGETLIHKAGETRAYASPAAFGGSVTMDLGNLIEPRGGVWAPVLVNRQPMTLAHEVGHRLDGIFGGYGFTGQAWKAREDYPEAAALWRSTFGDTYQAAWEIPTKGVGKGKPKIVKLPWNEPHSKYQYAGSWVDPYEARIYNGGTRKPTLDDVAPFGVTLAGGPIEFISMATQYVQEAGVQSFNAARARVLVTGGGAESWPRAYFKAITGWDEHHRQIGASSSRTWTALVKGRALYGTGYRDGLEALYGAGRRAVVRELEGGHLSFKGDHEVQAFALLVRFAHGVPLEDLVGPGGLLAGKLAAPLSAEALAQLEAAAAYLDGTTVADLALQTHPDLFELTGSADRFNAKVAELAAKAKPKPKGKP